MKKRFSLGFFLAAISAVTVVSVAATTAVFGFIVIPKRENEIYRYNQKILEINALVDKYYIGEINETTMSDGIGYGYVAGLDDRYAAYYTAEEAEATMNSLYGYNSGIGIQVVMHPDTGNIYVTNVNADSPAEECGLAIGDQISAIDGQTVESLGYGNSLAYIKTVPLGNEIRLDVIRNGENITLTAVLEQFVSQTVYSQMRDGYAYILITEFNDKTVDQFKAAVDSAEEQSAKGIIFDLRGNGGGTLNSVYRMVDYLVPSGLIIKVDYKDDAYDETYNSDDKEVNIPMVVLTDGNTASASELFSQSLIDFGKAVTVGRNTYGKGVVQRTFTLSDGSLVKFTVAKYYTASGICVDGVGIAPTVAVEWPDDELSHRFINGLDSDRDYKAAVEYLESQLS